jgi:hypothetical protein
MHKKIHDAINLEALMMLRFSEVQEKALHRLATCSDDEGKNETQDTPSDTLIART